ncbi:hypothetical protein Tco_0956164 [Tanacetum coccineum]|uniref:Uncharacterized protein n=1 Tax=Tanacetum coccineum TaxID=301880 RepID=A0ABQ5E971_9ASTR
MPLTKNYSDSDSETGKALSGVEPVPFSSNFKFFPCIFAILSLLPLCLTNTIGTTGLTGCFLLDLVLGVGFAEVGFTDVDFAEVGFEGFGFAEVGFKGVGLEGVAGVAHQKCQNHL